MQLCPECGSNNADAAHYCLQCGSPLGHPESGQPLLGIGDRLQNGRYVIKGLLGCGGLGAVYLADDTHFQGHEVAVKENHDAAMHQQFMREAHVLARLHHENLPRVSDFFVEQPPNKPSPRAYMVMDFVPGEDLWERIQREGPMSEQEVLKLFDGIFDALIYLHSQNPPIIHRDIKPQNIRITPDGKPFLVDFGIAKVGTGATSSSARAITPFYSPYEQYGSGGTDEKSDQYSLAATLYVALTGKVPTTPSGDPLEALERYREVKANKPDPLPPLSDCAPQVSKRVCDAIMQALAINKNDRFPSIQEFRDALYPKPKVLTRRQAITLALAGAIGASAIIYIGYRIWLAFQPIRLFRVLKGHTRGVTCVAFHPNGNLLASSSHDMTVKLWHWRSGKLFRTLTGHTKSIRSVSFDRHGRWLASASWDGTVRLWDANTGELLGILAEHNGFVHCIAFSPNGDWLVSGGEDGTVRLWDFADGIPHTSAMSFVGHRGAVYCVAFSPDERFIASGGADRVIRIWNVKSGELVDILRKHEGAVRCAEFSPDGKWLLSGGDDFRVCVWRVKTWALRACKEGFHLREVRSVAFTPNGKYALTAGMDDVVNIWRVRSWERVHVLKGGRNWALALAFDKDGHYLATASKDETVKVWFVNLSE